MRKVFDLVVIGTGTAGSIAASACRRAGWEVAVVDSRPFGGTCSLRGCDPKKVLVGAAEAIDWVRRMRGKGIEPDGARVDWRDLMRFKATFVEPVPAKKERSFIEAGIAVFHGRAHFADPTAIEVGGDTLMGRYVLIASGAMPAPLGFPGSEHVIDSTAFLELEALPKRIVFVGGGYVSLEFAHVARRAGAGACRPSWPAAARTVRSRLGFTARRCDARSWHRGPPWERGAQGGRNGERRTRRNSSR